jgi:hypothetical protein
VKFDGTHRPAVFSFESTAVMRQTSNKEGRKEGRLEQEWKLRLQSTFLPCCSNEAVGFSKSNFVSLMCDQEGRWMKIAGDFDGKFLREFQALIQSS